MVTSSAIAYYDSHLIEHIQDVTVVSREVFRHFTLRLFEGPGRARFLGPFYTPQSSH